MVQEDKSLPGVQHPQEALPEILRWIDEDGLPVHEFDARHVIHDDGIPGAGLVRAEAVHGPGLLRALPLDAAIGIEHREERLGLKRVARCHDEHSQSASRSIP